MLSQHKIFHLLILIMAFTSLAVGAITMASLYRTAIDQHRLRLVESVKSQARLIESIASFNAFENGSNIRDDWQAVTLRQIQNAHSQFEGFGKTGEYTMARLSQDRIEFILRHKYDDLNEPLSIPYRGDWAQPMRLALDGQSGTTIALDYRGEKVLAAYEPVAILNAGLVAKIDMSEIRSPFFLTSLIALAFGLIIIVIASRLFFRIARPITRQIEQQAETFRTLAETAHEGVILINTEGTIQYVNPAAEKMFGYAHGDLVGQSVNRLMSRSMREHHNDYIRNYLITGVGKIIGSGRQLIGQRKNGSQFPFYLSIGDIHLKHSRLFAGVLMDLSEQQRLQREIMEVPVREQRRIGQELHDGIGQQLTGLGMLATSLVNKASKPEFQLATQLASGLQETLTEVRRLSRGLVPMEIDAADFKPALVNLTIEFQRQSDIPITVSIDEHIELTDNDLAMHLYRIVQEALNNAIKHADASDIRVNMGVEGENCLMEIIDNGSGIPLEQHKFKGLGLSIMKYRCSLFEGKLGVTPVESGGTSVSCRFPVNKAMRF